MNILPKSQKETSREYALRVIKENVISLELAPGSQISENELAEVMGISRTPVREALIILARAKVVEIFPQRKSIVSLLDEDLIEEARFMRFAMETGVIELACERRTEEDLAILEQNVSLQRFYLQNDLREKVMQLDNEFHRILYGIAKATEIHDLMENMLIHFDRARKMALYSVSDEKIVKEHEAMLEAVRVGDKKEARNLVEVHLSRYKLDTSEIRKKYPEYFTRKTEKIG